MIENIPNSILEKTFNITDELLEQKQVLMEGINLLLRHALDTGDRKARTIITNTLTKLYSC